MIIEPLNSEEQAQMEAEEIARQGRLDAFGAALSNKRRDAMEGRTQTGIEEEWREDEEFYEGIDDANRSDETNTRNIKPVNQTGAASSTLTKDRKSGSNVFLNIVRPYVDFSAGRASDMLLPTDERAWQIKPTPIPSLTDARKSEQVISANGQQATLGEIAMLMIEEAKTKAEKAQTRIEDWHVESQFHAEIRKVIKDASKVGTGILKGPFPVKRKVRAIMRNKETKRVEIKVEQETKPASKRIDYWNFFPDRACGENIHNGSYTWERDYITARQLRDLKGTKDIDGNPFYLESSIDMCLAEGPQKKYDNQRGAVVGDTEQYEIWYYYGTAETDDLIAAGCDVNPGTVIPVLVTMVNDRVIKAARSTLDTGEFPYDVMVWQPRVGTWTGIGVARQVRTPQRMINAGARNMMDNAGLAAGPQIIVRKDIVKPADGKWELAPRKIWYVDESADATEVAHAFHVAQIPMQQVELLSIIEFAMKMAEDVTGLPLLMQGQQGAAPDTVGGMTMLQNNASTVLRSIAKTFDDLITEPHIRRYYEYLLIYGPDEDEKGEFMIDARGSSVLFERDAQNQAILQMAALVENPAFGLNPKKWIVEALRAQRLDPKRFQYTEEEQEQIDKQAQENPPKDPRIEATEIKVKGDIERENIKAKVTVEKSRIDTDRDTAYVQAETQRTQAEASAAERKGERDYRLALLKYANDNKMNLDNVKKELAKTAMELKVQKQLSGVKDSEGGTQVANPPTEPAGRADDGRAFEQ